MPAFQPGSSAASSGTQQLLQKQPLEPALGALRNGIRSQLQQLRLTADDLQECLMVCCWLISTPSTASVTVGS
jgi:hypothetical protein